MVRKPFVYTWLLPLMWGACSLIHFHFPGDEYGLYAMGSVAGSWIAVLVRFGDIHNPLIPLSIAGVGMLVMAGVGLLMDKLKVRKTLWASQFAVAVLVVMVRTILAYPSVERALSKNGSWWAYILFSFNLGLYISAALSLLENGIRAAWRRVRATSREADEPSCDDVQGA